VWSHGDYENDEDDDDDGIDMMMVLADLVAHDAVSPQLAP
jgi:hypothetical protein